MSASEFPLADTPVPSDATLLQRFRKRDFDAATQLYVKYAERLRKLVRANCSEKLARHVEPDDIVQSVFTDFFRRVAAGEYDVPEGDRLWNLLLVIALNKIRAKGAYHLAARRDIRRTAGNVPEDWFAGDRASDQLPYAYLRMTIEEAMEPLPRSHRLMVRMRIDGYPVSEIVAKTASSERTVERVLHDFRVRLAEILDEE
jgi:RNA polymerase sigma factor (sigma-70 family)